MFNSKGDIIPTKFDPGRKKVSKEHPHTAVRSLSLEIVQCTNERIYAVSDVKKLFDSGMPDAR